MVLEEITEVAKKEQRIEAKDLVMLQKQKSYDSEGPRLVDTVHQYVLEHICGGRWQPGEKITEASVGKELGISHVPVREAMEKLQQEGWVERIPNRGIFIKGVDVETIENLYQIREIIEVGAVDAIAKTIMSEQLAELKGVVELRESSYHTGKLDVVQQTDTHFHRLLVHFVGNPRLDATFESVLLQSNGSFFGLSERLPFDQEEVRKCLGTAGHRQIYEALEAHDLRKARQLIKKHITIGRITAVKAWEFFDELRNASR